MGVLKLLRDVKVKVDRLVPMWSRRAGHVGVLKQLRDAKVNIRMPVNKCKAPAHATHKIALCAT